MNQQNNTQKTEDIFLLVNKYLTHKGFKNGLDPFIGEFVSSDLLISLLEVETIKSGHGIILSQKEYEGIKAKTQKGKLNLALHLGTSLDVLASIKDKFDLIVSFPPMGIRMFKEEIEKHKLQKINDDYSNIVITKALEKLNDDGECVAVLPDNFFIKSNGARTFLVENGYFINSVIKLYPSILRPFASVIPNIVVISKTNTNGVFIAKYDPDYDKDNFVKNWVNRTPSKNVELGTIVEQESLTTVEAWFNKTKITQELNRYPFKNRQIKNLASEVILGSYGKKNDSFKEKPNSLYIPLLGTSNAVTTIPELNIKAQNYIQLVLDDTIVFNEYLAGFLNSALGKELLNASKTGSIIEKLTKNNLEQINVPLPSIEQQKDFIKLSSRISQLRTIAGDLSKKLWDKPTSTKLVEKELDLINKGDEIEYLIKHLPFPLASILMKYHREDSPHKATEYLNYFFEALAELLATIFISSFYYEKEGKKILQKLLSTEEDKRAIRKTTFGGWVNIATRLAKKYRELISSDKVEDKTYARELLKVNSTSAIDALLSKEIYLILDDVSKKRNDWLGHSAPVNNNDALKRCDLLRYNLDKIYDQLIQIFGDFILVKARDEMTFEEGTFKIKVDIISGSDVNFERKQIIVNKPLDKNLLHFYEEGNAQTLQLLPFVKLRPSPTTELNSCYFYNRTEKDGDYRWLSYHFDKESEVVEGNELLNKAIGEII